MPSKRTALLLVFPLALCGCVTEMVQETAPQKGPVPQVGYIIPGGGEIRYSAEGWGPVVAARRRAAFFRMHRVCKDMGLKIIDEFVHTDATVPYNGGDLQTDAEFGIQHYDLEKYHHIMFQCVPPPLPPEPSAAAPAKTAPKATAAPAPAKN